MKVEEIFKDYPELMAKPHMKIQETNINSDNSISFKLCVECQKPTYKGRRCNSCYSKAYRKTEKGRESMQKYNMTIGRETQRRWREKQKINRPPKPPKPNCECGSPSITKGFCINCYMKYYQRKNRNQKTPHRKRKTRIDCNVIFEKVLSLVKTGMTITGACKQLKFRHQNLYHLLSAEQKSELRICKIIGPMDYDDNIDSYEI